MVTKYEELAQGAVDMLAELDELERDLTGKATSLIRGYALHIQAPAGKVRFVPVDAHGQELGESLPLEAEAPLEQQRRNIFWVGMKIEYRHPSRVMYFLVETIPLGFSKSSSGNGCTVQMLDGKTFDLLSDAQVIALYEFLSRGTDERIKTLLDSGKRAIGFVQ